MLVVNLIKLSALVHALSFVAPLQLPNWWLATSQRLAFVYLLSLSQGTSRLSFPNITGWVNKTDCFAHRSQNILELILTTGTTQIRRFVENKLFECHHSQIGC